MRPKIIKNLKWDESYLKYLVLHIFFSLLMVFAIVLLITSNGVSNKTHKYIDDFSQTNVVKVSIALTFTSFVITLIAFIGCCATYSKSKLILVLFCVLLTLLIILEIFCAVLSFRYVARLKNKKIENQFKDLTLKYDWVNETSDINSNVIVNGIQSKYSCCGTDSYKSWDELRPQSIDKNLYPFSCCHNLVNQNISDLCIKDRVNQTNSCNDSLNEELNRIKSLVSVMAGMTITNTVIKLIGIPIVWYFGRQLPENLIV